MNGLANLREDKIMIPIFITLQSILLFFMLFHDWIAFPPFNDVEKIKLSDKLIQAVINGVTVVIPLLITLLAYHRSYLSFSASINIFIFYFILSVGTILSWWIPYLFGSSQKHKQAFNKFKNTHHFLPKRGDNVVPNTLHVVLHLQIWACLVISLYLLSNSLS